MDNIKIYRAKIENWIQNWFHKEKKIIGISCMAAFVITFGVALSTKAYSDTIQRSIAEEVIRFHVLANSDLDFDQELKLLVRDGVLEEYQELLDASESIEQTREILIDNLDGIKKCAEEIIAEQGYGYSVTVNLSRDMFPTKAYGDVTFPAGEYEALRIVIGEGEGQNWWCVMFPPLCFVDVTKDEIPEDVKEELREIFNEDEYNLLTVSAEDTPIKIKFKIVEWWQERKDTESFVVLK